MEQVIVLEKFLSIKSNMKDKNTIIHEEKPIPVLAAKTREGEQIKILTESDGFISIAYRKRTLTKNETTTSIGVYDRKLEKQGYLSLFHHKRIITSSDVFNTNPNWQKHSFAFTDPRTTSEHYGTPVGFSPCTPITWAVDLANIEQSGFTRDKEPHLIEQVLQEISSFTNYTFTRVDVPDGLGETENKWRNLNTPPVDLLISYGTSETTGTGYSKHLEGNFGIASWMTLTNWDDTSMRLTFDRSAVVLNYYALKQLNTSDSARMNLMRHEIGHALGLGHVEETGQYALSVMMANSNYGAFYGWGYGNIQGLKELSTVPCS